MKLYACLCLLLVSPTLQVSPLQAAERPATVSTTHRAGLFRSNYYAVPYAAPSPGNNISITTPAPASDPAVLAMLNVIANQNTALAAQSANQHAQLLGLMYHQPAPNPFFPPVPIQPVPNISITTPPAPIQPQPQPITITTPPPVVSPPITITHPAPVVPNPSAPIYSFPAPGNPLITPGAPGAPIWAPPPPSPNPIYQPGAPGAPLITPGAPTAPAAGKASVARPAPFPQRFVQR